MMLLLVLTACDSQNNWFVHPVEYNQKTAKGMLVITANMEAGQTPLVYVTHSFFFLSPQKQDTTGIWYRYDDRMEWQSFGSVTQQRGFLHNAQVEMQVNGGAWQALQGVDTLYIVDNGGWYVRYKGYAYISDYIVREGDSICIRVQHSDYNQAHATVVVPQKTDCEVKLYDRDEKEERRIRFFDLMVPSYVGKASDKMCIVATTYDHMLNEYPAGHFVDTVYKGVKMPIWKADSIQRRVSCRAYPYIYSEDIRFAAYPALNISLSGGVYGSDEWGLYTDANTSGNTTKYHMATYWNNEYSEIQDYSSYYGGKLIGDECIEKHEYKIDSLVIDVYMRTSESYLYTASLLQALDNHSYVTNFWGGNDGMDDFEDIMDEIQDIFDELGNMEGVQLYSNIENGCGHLSAASKQSITIRF